MRFRHLIWIHLFFITLYGESKETESINNQYNLKKYDALRIYFDCSIGNLKIRPSNNRYIVTSNISYSSILSKPEINLSDKNNVARLDFKVSPEGISANANTFNSLLDKGNDNYIINFQMPTKISTDMNLSFGLGKVDLDFSGLRISKLTMDCGLSDVTLISKKSNIIDCESIKISTGVSDFNSVGLGNLNSSFYHFDVGVGSAEIDMSGSANRDTKVKIEVTFGSLELKLPKNTNLNLIVDQNLLSSVNIKDLVSSGDGKYESKENQKRWASMDIEISVGVGSIDVFME